MLPDKPGKASQGRGLLRWAGESARSPPGEGESREMHSLLSVASKSASALHTPRGSHRGTLFLTYLRP